VKAAKLALTLAAVLPLVASCKLFEGKKNGSSDDKGSPPTPAPQAAPDAGAGFRDLGYVLSVAYVAEAEAAAATVTYQSVRPLLAAQCVSCHPAGNAFDVSNYPFKSRFPDPAEGVRELLRRVQDDARPMPPPPAARLSAADIKTLKDWLDQGLLMAPRAAADQTFANALRVRFRWRLAGTDIGSEFLMPWNGSGQYQGQLVRLPIGVPLTAAVSVIGEDGTELATGTYDGLKVPATGDLVLRTSVTDAQARAHALDGEGPAAGNGGDLEPKDVGERVMTVKWGKAHDRVTRDGEIMYAVYVGTEPEPKTLAMDFKKDVGELTLGDLKPGTTYYVRVVAKDAAGNVTAYKTLQQATSFDQQAPVVTNGVLTVSELTATSVKLTIVPAVDNLTTPDKLKYTIYSSLTDNVKTLVEAQTNGLAAGPAALGTTRALKGLIPNTAYYLNVVVEDERANKSAYTSVRLATGGGSNALDRFAYAKECAERLGEIKPFSCLDGKIMPISINGQEITPGLSQQQAAQYNFTGGTQVACDKPALLGMGNQGRCVPYSRVGRLKTYRKDGSERADVDTVFTCRRYVARLGPQTYQGQAMDGADHPLFEDIAILQHNRETGETCWFQMLRPNHAGADGRRIPPPTEETLPAGVPAHAIAAKDYWLTPVETAAKNCNNCHDSDPWMHSPYIDQVKGDDGQPIVPAGGFAGGRKGRYAMLGSAGFNNWARSQAVIPKNNALCVSCHTIGSIRTCQNWARYSAGVATAPNTSAFAQASFHHKYWMPPLDPSITNAAQWDAAHKAAITSLVNCCNNPGDTTNCERRPIMTAPLPYEPAG